MEKILVLEDEVDIGNLVAFNLRRNGYDVEVEHDGREGLGRILKEQPDLVTLDLMMPGMDGYQVLKEMQRDPRSYKIPVLMLTAKSQLDDHACSKRFRIRRSFFTRLGRRFISTSKIN